ncbi:transposase [Kordia sp. YSTF-M3]|uniref:Transposase n=1 Tax=Kordia aestuariivivens TaxID=2759037 RepID=A0ABR7QBY2_9FLAO|nr:transposase [Kordia aestuariivivens]MBC8756037.1 transposase [Kordia aestuariivivens]
MKKRIYSKEFKSQTVQLSYNRSNIKEFADELGISVQRIYKWRKVAKKASTPKQETPVAQEQLEIKRLTKLLRAKKWNLRS